MLQPGALRREQRPVLGYFRQSQGGRCLRCRIAFAAADEAEAITHFERHHRWVCVYLAPEGESAHGDLYQFAYAEPPRRRETEIADPEDDGESDG
jgi:hypothetical protein